MPISKQVFLRAIAILENPKGFTIQEPLSEEFYTFLNIGYAEAFKEKKVQEISSSWSIDGTHAPHPSMYLRKTWRNKHHEQTLDLRFQQHSLREDECC